jgi:hypothetical protein
LPAIFGFSVAGFGGALFLAHSTFTTAETAHSLATSKPVVVFEARAVPLDSKPEDVAARATAVVRALTAIPAESQRPETNAADPELEKSDSTFLPTTNGELRGFSRFAYSGSANNYLTLSGITFGMSAHMAPSGISATDAAIIVSTPVPEASTWLCGAALLALVVARGLHATWHRHQRRIGNKSDSQH